MKLPQSLRDYPYPAVRVRDPSVLKELEKYRYLGYRGGFIFKHRAMLTVHRNLSKTLSSVALAAALFVGWLIALRWVTVAWAYILDFWREALGMGGYVTISHYMIFGLYRFTVPYLHVSAGQPDYITLLIGGLVTVLLFLMTFFLPVRYLPVVYLIRIATIFHASAQVFFGFIPLAFPYNASGYIHGVLIAGLALISLMPIVLGFTFYVFDFSVIRKVVFSLIIMGCLWLMIPFQYMAHAFILHHLSILFLPILFFIFGLPLNVMTFMALYSWGTSWRYSSRLMDFRAESDKS
jgi:hypothetical protein